MGGQDVGARESRKTASNDLSVWALAWEPDAASLHSNQILVGSSYETGFRPVLEILA